MSVTIPARSDASLAKKDSMNPIDPKAHPAPESPQQNGGRSAESLTALLERSIPSQMSTPAQSISAVMPK